jgi:NitT/TauT family transport system substrate-binding protein
LAVSTGKLDLSNAAGLAAPLLFLEQGNDLVFFGGRMGEGHTLFANPENVAQYANFNITTLYGKKFGWYRGDTGGMLVRGWLATNGADISKITFVELDSYRTVIEAIRKGEIDVGNLSGFNRPTAVAQGLKEVLHLDSLVPNFPCCRLVTSGKILKERREDLVGFLKAQIRAYKVFKEDHEKTLDITAKYFDVERNVRETIFYTYGHYNFSPDPEKKRIVDFYSGIAAAGFAKGTADVASHIDTSLYRDALDQILIEYPGDPFYLEMKKHFDENN